MALRVDEENDKMDSYIMVARTNAITNTMTLNNKYKNTENLNNKLHRAQHAGDHSHYVHVVHTNHVPVAVTSASSIPLINNNNNTRITTNRRLPRHLPAIRKQTFGQ